MALFYKEVATALHCAIVSNTPTGDLPGGMATPSNDEVSRREHILQQLEQLDVAQVGWEEYEADRAMPLEMRRYPPPPDVPREVLAERHASLVAELGRLGAEGE